MNFDYTLYKSLYSDIKNFNKNDAYEHYINIGNKENRICNKNMLIKIKNLYKGFNYEFFKKLYPEYLKLLINNSDIAIAYLYKNNITENINNLNDLLRLYPYFDYNFYMDLYTDLLKNGINNLEKSLIHYYRFGKNEKRFCNLMELLSFYEHFDYKFYIELYEDLPKNNINDLKSSIIHFHNFGRFENRFTNLIDLKNQYDGFDYKFYLSLYPDLLEKNIDTESKTLFHYYNHGKKENRIYNLQKFLEFNQFINKLIDKQMIKLKYINDNNYNNFQILTRTHNRPYSFNNNYNSLISQNYPKNHYNHLVSYHNNDTYNYLVNYNENITKLCVKEIKIIKDKDNIYPYNLYLNDLLQITNDNTWLIFVDDDDLFVNNYCLNGINSEINRIKKEHKNDNFILFWRVYRCDQLTGNTSYGKRDIDYNIALCGFTINSKYKDFLKFDTNKVAISIKNLSKILDVYWSNYIFTKIGQTNTIAGFNKKEI